MLQTCKLFIRTVQNNNTKTYDVNSSLNDWIAELQQNKGDVAVTFDESRVPLITDEITRVSIA